MTNLAAYSKALHRAMRVRDDLLKREYSEKALGRPRRHYTEGHCFAVSEALFYLLGGKEAGYMGMCVTHEGGTHWFVRHLPTGKNIDLTSEQFSTPVPYEKATGKGWMNPKGWVPNARAQAFMDMVLNENKAAA